MLLSDSSSSWLEPISVVQWLSGDFSAKPVWPKIQGTSAKQRRTRWLILLVVSFHRRSAVHLVELPGKHESLRISTEPATSTPDFQAQLSDWRDSSLFIVLKNNIFDGQIVYQPIQTSGASSVEWGHNRYPAREIHADERLYLITTSSREVDQYSDWLIYVI